MAKTESESQTETRYKVRYLPITISEIGPEVTIPDNYTVIGVIADTIICLEKLGTAIKEQVEEIPERT